MDIPKTTRKQSRSRKLLNGMAADDSPAHSSYTPALEAPTTHEQSHNTSEDIFSSHGGPKPFSLLLSFLLKNDRSEILRLAREIGVSDNTIYRWINGTSEPRLSHMHRLLEVLPHPSHLRSIVAGGTASSAAGRGSSQVQHDRWEVPGEIYRRVMEQVATTADAVSRRWHIIETVFEYALLHLDPEHQGMALTYARLMPPREDGTIHSLYEAEMRGQAPWPFALDVKAFLGSTTLAGSAVLLQRVQTWSRKDEDARYPVGLDDNEHSSCAAPVMRGGHLAGVLIVSSARNDFMSNAAIPRAVGEYARLLGVGMPDNDFHPIEMVRLVPMPELKWQRDHITNTYLNRVVECARKQCLSFTEAEQQVLQALEGEFEQYTHASNLTAHRPSATLAREPIR